MKGKRAFMAFLVLAVAASAVAIAPSAQAQRARVAQLRNGLKGQAFSASFNSGAGPCPNTSCDIASNGQPVPCTAVDITTTGGAFAACLNTSEVFTLDGTGGNCEAVSGPGTVGKTSIFIEGNLCAFSGLHPNVINAVFSTSNEGGGDLSAIFPVTPNPAPGTVTILGLLK